MKLITTEDRRDIRVSIQKTNKAEFLNYTISFFPKNQKHLQFQVSDYFMTLEFSDNLTDCVTYINDRIKKGI
jgi:hypothetical protein